MAAFYLFRLFIEIEKALNRFDSGVSLTKIKCFQQHKYVRINISINQIQLFSLIS